jgi:hypothetical protein
MQLKTSATPQKKDNSSLTERLFYPQEGLSSVELVI